MNLESSSFISICSILPVRYKLIIAFQRHTSIPTPFTHSFCNISMIIAVQKAKQNPLTQSLKIKTHRDREDTDGSSQPPRASRPSQPAFPRPQPISHISSTCIAKTITHSSLLPQQIPKAIELRQPFRTIAPRPFFSRHRRLTEGRREREESKKEKRAGRGDSGPSCFLEADFTHMLKAKSTVIKQKNLQEFYINREGRRQEQQQSLTYLGQSFKSNLFRPNFPKKSHKLRRHSFHAEKTAMRFADSLETPPQGLKVRSRNAFSFAETPLEADSLPLKERKGNDTPLMEKGGRAMTGKGGVEKARRGRRPRIGEKENLQFDLKPWDNHEPDDVFF